MKLEEISGLINDVKAVNPLVVHYTNEVTINDCANATLALGASPLMSYSYDEIEDVVGVASAVVINIGTMHSSHIDLFVQAGEAANKLNKPVILDPVGVFASKARQQLVNTLLNKVKFDVVKGNLAEIKFIAGLDVEGKGVDSFDDDANAEAIAKAVAQKLGSIIIATGKADIVTDGEKVIKIHNGTAKLKGITGTGCMTASLIGSYLGTGKEPLACAAMGTLTMSLAGELADDGKIGTGSFRVKLIDTINELTQDTINQYGKVESYDHYKLFI